MNDRSYISATTGELRGIPGVEPVLRLTFNVEAGGLADGASALFLATANIESGPGRLLSLGTAAPVLKLLGFPEREGEDVYKTPVYAEWKLTDTGIERIEKLRDGGDLTIYPNLEYALISAGIAPPDWRQPERPVRATWPRQPTNIRIDSHQWATNVLEPLQLAGAVSLVVALPSAATDEQRAVVARLATARQRLTAGKPDDLKASISASREAVELLRAMRPATVNSLAQKRDLAEREAVILDKVKDLAQALFAYDSAASHTNPHLRDIAWKPRERSPCTWYRCQSRTAHLRPDVTRSRKADGDGVLITTVMPALVGSRPASSATPT